MNRRTMGIGLAILAPVLATTALAHADETAELQQLLNEDVVTTASKAAETGSTAPAIVTSISAEDLQHYGIHSLDEAIDFLSLGMVTQNPLRSVDIGARGVLLPKDQGSHVLLLLDGHAMNEPLFSAARFERGAGIPFELIDHIEVILGPGAVLYGNNAMLGVINVITKRAKDFKGMHLIAESEVGKSTRVAAGAGYEFSLAGKAAELTFEAEYYRQNGPAFSFAPRYFGIDDLANMPAQYTRNGPPNGIWGGVAHDSYYATVPAALVRLVWDNLQVELNASSYKRAAPYDTQRQTDFDDPSSYELDRSMRLDLKHQATLSSVVQLSTRLYGDIFDYQRYNNTSTALTCAYPRVFTCQTYSTGASRWAGAELQSSFDWFRDARFVTLLGVDGNVRSIDSKTDTLDFDTRNQLAPSTGLIHAFSGLLGTYAQQTWRPTVWAGINGGTRLDYDPRFAPVLSPRLAAFVNPWTNGTLKAVYSQAFRAPSWLETSSYGFDIVHAQDLKPETVRSVEGSLEQKFGTQRILFGVFRTWWTDLVEFYPLTIQEISQQQRLGNLPLNAASGVYQYRNISSIDNYGLNAAYEGSQAEGAVRYGINITGAYARIAGASQSASLPVAPQLFGNAHVSYDLPGALPILGLAGHYIGRRTADEPFDKNFFGTSFAPPQVELRATVSGPVQPVKGLSYRLSANYAAASHTAYVVAPVVHQIPLPDQLAPVDTFRVTLGLQYTFLTQETR